MSVFPVPMLASLRGAGGPSIALVQQSVGSSTDGSVPLIIPFGSAVVAGAGTSAANGTYTYRGQYQGKPYFNLLGQPDDPDNYSVFWDSANGYWVIRNPNTYQYVSDGVDVSLPWLATWTVGGDGSGSAPAPTVTCSSPVTAGNSVLVQIAFDPSKALFSSDPPLQLLGGGSGGLGSPTVANEAANNIWVYNWQFLSDQVTGGESGVTFTLDTAVPVAVNISEWSGLADAGPEDTHANSGSGNTASADPIDPASASNLCIACYATVGDEYSAGPSGGFTRMTPANVTGIYLESAYLIQSAATEAQAEWDLLASVDWSVISLAFGGS